MAMEYCGYCGEDFLRARGAPADICQACLANEEIAEVYWEDTAVDAADRANDAELAREQWKA
jgi:hypothetical protein